MEFLWGVEQAAQSPADSQVEVLRNGDRFKFLLDNVTGGERRSLNNLWNDPDIVVSPADSGNAVMALDSASYNKQEDGHPDPE